MKIIYCFWIFLSGALLLGCYNEDDLHVGEQHYKRVYDTTSSDPVWKYVSQYYYKYGKLLITDPDSSDYVFNFDSKYALWLQKPNQDKAHLQKSLQFIKEVFLDGYSDECKRELFPFKVILADSIVYIGSTEPGKEWQPRDIYVTDNHISFSVSEHTLNLSEEEKEELSSEWNGKFLNDYLKGKTGWSVPEEFYLYATDSEFSSNFKHEIYPYTEEDYWALGYAKAKDFETYGQGSDGEWGFIPVGFQVASSRASYLEQFIEFLFTTPQTTMQRALQFEKFKKAHDILDQSLKADLEIDYRNIGYKVSK